MQVNTKHDVQFKAVFPEKLLLDSSKEAVGLTFKVTGKDLKTFKNLLDGDTVTLLKPTEKDFALSNQSASPSLVDIKARGLKNEVLKFLKAVDLTPESVKEHIIDSKVGSYFKDKPNQLEAFSAPIINVTKKIIKEIRENLA